MKITKKNHELLRENNQIMKKSQKHDANLQKNSTVYFQVGLMLVLLAILGLFEMTFETTIPNYSSPFPPDKPLYVHVPVIKPETPSKEKPIEKKKNKGNVFKEVPNHKPTNPFVNVDKQTPTLDINPPVDTGSIDVLPMPTDDDFDFIKVEQVPIYPGCEKAKDNEERKECMSNKINKLIQKKFNGDIASNYGLTGIQRINVVFKIDKTGRVTDIKTRASHPKLQEEAERVVNIIPNMQPGKQRNIPVGVIYSLPIVFKVQN
ncbi:MAG: energy transducer TonB [Flavobacteriales bacterium]|nr:energy transducer TonB [Flavobacteriia bacterium]NCP06558.1 energy transducer TonB [Flavobacteriales bacterium]PIV94347.1 MAG: energy transducer TonB [Flavobacteriaceae bacterium CG17_big_fil_post_rev_8_21_14_2_50_33_15]PIY10396.1 MAG: energy transducer TonB [Flavobacteriaceae bacterium CG_4_10_14_3_um_filter_33_47]PJB20447.1 MAG: energy transducer TonB [Flavobacteriaceae bacterium CG_4_9_14_3_um_filter_33_16]